MVQKISVVALNETEARESLISPAMADWMLLTACSPSLSAARHICGAQLICASVPNPVHPVGPASQPWTDLYYGSIRGIQFLPRRHACMVHVQHTCTYISCQAGACSRALLHNSHNTSPHAMFLKSSVVPAFCFIERKSVTWHLPMSWSRGVVKGPVGFSWRSSPEQATPVEQLTVTWLKSTLQMNSDVNLEIAEARHLNFKSSYTLLVSFLPIILLLLKSVVLELSLDDCRYVRCLYRWYSCCMCFHPLKLDHKQMKESCYTCICSSSYVHQLCFYLNLCWAWL